MSQHLKMIPNLKIHNQSKSHYAQDNHFQYYSKYYQTICLHVVTICKQCTTIIIKTKFNDGDTPESYLKLHQGNVLLLPDLMLSDVLHQFLLLGLEKYKKGSGKIQTMRTMNQIKQYYKPISLIQPKVVETKLLEAEDRASNEHPSLSQ